MLCVIVRKVQARRIKRRWTAGMAVAAVLLLSGANGKEQRGMGAGSALGEGERE